MVATFGSTSVRTVRAAKHRQRRACALDLKPLLVMARAARQQAQTDDPVAHDHDGSKNRVTRQFRLSVRSRNHNRDDQRHLDHRHSDGENQRAKWFAGAVRDYLGVIDGRKHRRHQCGFRDHGHETAHTEGKRDQQDDPGR